MPQYVPYLLSDALQAPAKVARTVGPASTVSQLSSIGPSGSTAESTAGEELCYNRV